METPAEDTFSIDELEDYTFSDNETDNSSSTNAPPSSVPWRMFLLSPELLRAIQDCGFETASSVQNASIPYGLIGVDLLCQSKSGSGKTAIFILCILQQILIHLKYPNPSKTTVDTTTEESPSSSTTTTVIKNKKAVKAVIIVPSIELAYQTHQEFERFAKYTIPAITCASFYGGVPVSQDRKKLSGAVEEDFPDVVIGTPGRICQLIKERVLKLDQIESFVIDECDYIIQQQQMVEDLKKIISATPEEKQLMAFSATIDANTKLKCLQWTRGFPEQIGFKPEDKLDGIVTNNIAQYLLQQQNETEKMSTLVSILDLLEFHIVLIFVRSQLRAESLNTSLQSQNFPSIVVHSKLSTQYRITKFKAARLFYSRVIVSTEGAMARGVDLHRVNCVINYDMPEERDELLAWSGKSSRAPWFSC